MQSRVAALCCYRDGMLATTLAMVLAAGGAASVDVDPAALTEPVRIERALVIGQVGQGGRRPVHTDAIEARIVAGDLGLPGPGHPIELPDGVSWEGHLAGLLAGVVVARALAKQTTARR